MITRVSTISNVCGWGTKNPYPQKKIKKKSKKVLTQKPFSAILDTELRKGVDIYV